MRKLKFQIGQWVRSSYIALFKYKNNERVVVRREREICGQIVGAVYRQLGRYSESSDYDDPPRLIVCKMILVWRVAIGYLNHPVDVLEEDLQVIDNQVLPFKWTNSLPWTDKDRDMMRKCAMEQQRDARGRFRKGV
jgi:hypothetical protein